MNTLKNIAIGLVLVSGLSGCKLAHDNKNVAAADQSKFERVKTVEVKKQVEKVKTYRDLTNKTQVQLCEKYIKSMGFSGKIVDKTAGYQFAGITLKQKGGARYSYACTITENVIGWSAIMRNGDLGRYRYEDETRLTYTTKGVTFKMNSKQHTVKL